MCYELRKFNEHENNYVTHDLDLATIIHALKMWRNYLLGSKFILVSDQSGSKYLFDQHNINSIQARWLPMLNGFDF